MPKPTTPSTIGDNPLEAMVSAAATLAAIQGLRPRSPAPERVDVLRVPLNLNLPIPLVRELQTVVAVHTGMDIDQVAEAALRLWLREQRPLPARTLGGTQEVEGEPRKKGKREKAREKEERKKRKNEKKEKKEKKRKKD